MDLTKKQQVNTKKVINLMRPSDDKLAGTYFKKEEGLEEVKGEFYIIPFYQVFQLKGGFDSKEATQTTIQGIECFKIEKESTEIVFMEKNRFESTLNDSTEKPFFIRNRNANINNVRFEQMIPWCSQFEKAKAKSLGIKLYNHIFAVMYDLKTKKHEIVEIVLKGSSFGAINLYNYSFASDYFLFKNETTIYKSTKGDLKIPEYVKLNTDTKNEKLIAGLKTIATDSLDQIKETIQNHNDLFMDSFGVKPVQKEQKQTQKALLPVVEIFNDDGDLTEYFKRMHKAFHEGKTIEEFQKHAVLSPEVIVAIKRTELPKFDKETGEVLVVKSEILYKYPDGSYYDEFIQLWTEAWTGDFETALLSAIDSYNLTEEMIADLKNEFLSPGDELPF